ncbi:MAG: hypothetical protein A4S09_11570 [Proteobacteria bacterium SG_bin7]|nr:MAG: hypothetical protein A4S09_11570 [Proteobacteria bacterium SG_bin7]
MLLDTPWPELTFVSFDIEATGPYPLEGEICEIAAIKWEGGQVIGEFQTLIKPLYPMTDFIIGIHGITNEMVATAPSIGEKISEFRDFIGGDILVAHHSPFDMGFLALEFERARLPLPEEPVLCSSLISRKIITEAENHKLQTLIKVLNLNQGTAHRALDDAKACIELLNKCLERLGEDKTLRDLIDLQEKQLYWKNFSIEYLLKNESTRAILNAIEKKKPVVIVYQGGSLKGERQVTPKGIVRSPDGDFLAALDEGDPQVKRFYLGKIKSAVCY